MKVTVPSFNKFPVLACLYIAQAIPGHFASNAMPVIMRHEGFSLESIGLIGLVSIPWALKFLWAPLIDRYGGQKNHYRKWIIPMQCAFALITCIAAAFNINDNFHTILFLMFASYVFSATQDIAVDAYAFKMLSLEERGLGNGIQTAGNIFGIVIGSSAALVLFLETSWSITLMTIAIFVILLGLPILFTEEKPNHKQYNSSPKEILRFFRIKGIWSWSIVLVPIFGSLFSINTMCKALMVDHGFSWLFIATTLGAIPLCGIPVAIWTGISLRKYSRLKVFVATTTLNTLVSLALVPIANGFGDSKLFFICFASNWAVIAMLLTTINTLAMDFARKGQEGSDLAIFVSIGLIGGMISMAIGGIVTQRFGYSALFISSAVLSMVAGILSIFICRNHHTKLPSSII